MSDVLATYLLREQLLKADQVDDFLQLQVVMGGAFETQVLEGQVMSEERLLRAMSEAYRMPPLTRDEIEDIPQKMPDIFPRVFAETYRMIPYRLIGRNLGVLVAEKPDETAVMKLEQRLKIKIIPAVTSEPRIYHAMQRLYGVEIPPRFSALLAQLDSAAPLTEKPRPAVVALIDSTHAKEGAFARGQASAVAVSAEAPTPVAPAPLSRASLAKNTVEASKEEPVFQRDRPSVIPDRPEVMDLETAIRRVQLARDRDQILDVALAFANNAFKFSSFFILQGNSFVGYSGKGDATSSMRVSRVIVPLLLQSMFKTVHDTQGHYLGVVPEVGVNTAILDDLQRGRPKIVFLAPVVIRGKLTGLIYCDNGKRGVSSRKVADLLVLVTRLGAIFERLIQRKKAEVKVAANVVTQAAKKAAVLKALSETETIVHEAPVEEPVAILPAALVAETPTIDAHDDIHVNIDDDDTSPPKVEAPPASFDFEFQHDEPTIAITFGDGQTETPISTTDLLSQRFLNVLKAAEEEEDERDEESIDASSITAEALLGDLPRAAASAPAAPKMTSLIDLPAPTEDRHYRVFAELHDESEEDEAKGWEDVLVDTIAQGKQGGTANATGGSVPIPDEVGWEDIIVEAAAQAHGAAASEKAPRLDDLSVLLDAIDSPDEDTARRASESLWQRRGELGDSFASMLGARFPGRMRVDPFVATPLPPIAEMSAVMRLLVALGAEAAESVLPHIESQYPAHRLIASAFFSQVVYGQAFTKLLRRLSDEEPRVREVAADTLRRYARLPGYDDGLQRIRERLQMPMLEAQARACEILGRLRDIKSVPLLITLVTHKRGDVSGAALSALMRITAQDFGHNDSAWSTWWKKRGAQPREEWLVSGLRKDEPALRVIADEELRLLTGLQMGFDPTADKRAQEPAIDAWSTWWRQELESRDRI
jgi:Type II secretion system (T2SS), protein E, N-terminal domain